MNNKIAYYKTTKFKYTLTIIVSILVVIAGMVVFTENRFGHNHAIYADRTIERKESFSAISSLETQNLRSLVIENTYWDDMVAYIAQPNQKFEDEIFKAQLVTYEASAIWAYNKNGQLVTNINAFSSTNSNLDLGFDAKALQTVFKDDYLAHFYRMTNAGLLEVYGATVHGSADVDHVTPAEGYFFVARILGPDYVEKLEIATKDQVELVPLSQSTTLPPSNPKTGTITFANSLRDETGAPVAELYASFRAIAISDLYTSLVKTIFFAISFLVIILIVIYKILNGLIVRPLNTVYLSLRTENVDILSELQTKDTEFGRIAALIVDSQRQKEEMIETTAKMKSTQEKLEARTKEIEAINGLMINRELRMEELKKENQELKTDKK